MSGDFPLLPAAKLAKLPGYAREHIARLGQVLRETRAELDAMRTGDIEATDTLIDDYPRYHYLPPGSTALFVFERRSGGRIYGIRVRMSEDHNGRPALDVSGELGLIALPAAANHLYLRLDTR